VKAARHAENTFVGVPCGILDQGVSGFGRKDHLVFIDCREPRFETVPLPPEAHFWIFNTHAKHALVDGLYAARHRECLEAARALGVERLADVDPRDFPARANTLPELLARRAAHIVGEIARVAEVRAALARSDLISIGRALNASHASSRRNFENSTAELDFLAGDLAARAGVFGARLTGGGFGGAVMALTAAEFSPADAEDVAWNYERKFGARPDILHTRTGDGAALL
jgi:galactokinase